MTNEELKKKIVEIISQTWREPVPCTAERKFESIADALIAAGIGDVSDLEAKRDELRLASEYYINELKGAEKLIKKAEHRAEIAERALKLAEKLGELCAPAKDYIKQAEKELAEEGKEW